MTKNKENHCNSCGFEVKVVSRKASVVYNCLECGYRIPSSTKICKNDGKAGYYEKDLAQTKMNYKCKRCGHKNTQESQPKHKPSEDALFKKSKFNRKFINTYARNQDDGVLVAEFIQSLKFDKDITALKDFLLPQQILSNIVSETECDKGVEKSYLENILYWFLSTFMTGNLESLPIKMASDQSKRTVSRRLTDHAVISANALGERLANEKLVEALEKTLELCVARSHSKVFNDKVDLKPVYYDWMYITKSGDSWKICKNLPRSEDFHGYKIGIGNDWNSKSIVSLVFHGEEHPNDSVSFQRDLCIDNAPGLINITDRGPFDTKYMAQMSKRGQYFIIRLKKNIKFFPVHLKEHHDDFISLNIISKPKMRWRATETEFNILQHSFGLEKLYVRDPVKVWPLFLIATICKSVFQRVLDAIHSIHGGSIDMATFKVNLGVLIEHIARGSSEELPFDPCNAILCPYRKKHGTRWR